ncbi:MAG TPA: hypothetical protein VMU61_14435 [Candidatus Aquilonibacter sp.]|nr:hypothetical protein [Candidatus Aquilonibacter sp.]
MRTLSALVSILVLSAVGLAQGGQRGIPGYCPYGCGPYVPLITTPSVSFETVSPDPAGATNATGGLVAGATNSTLSEVSGNTSAVYSEPVWYSGGGTPLIAPAVNSPVGSMRMMRPEHFRPMHRERQPERQSWVYFSSAAQSPRALEKASAATGVHPANRAYTNEDIEKLNEQNGTVHYDSKTEKIQ